MSFNNNANMMNTNASTTRSGTAYKQNVPLAAHNTNISSVATGQQQQLHHDNLSNDRLDNNNLRTQQSQFGENAMTRSEEQLHVQKATVPAGKAELNKYVSTEHVTQAVPVSQEKVVLEREPINASNMGQAMKGPAISEAHYETTLKKDVVTAQKETVPVERIRLAKQTETGVENIAADLRKEHVDLTTNNPEKVDLGAGRSVADKVDSVGYQSNGYAPSHLDNNKIDNGLNRNVVAPSSQNAIAPGLSTEKARTETY